MSTTSNATISPTLAFGAGCYWGTEKFLVKDFQKQFGQQVIQEAAVGFMNPDPNGVVNPNYRQVCSGTTGHVEVLNVVLKQEYATVETIEDMIRFFYMFHDPTTKNRQGNDAGTQYASIIFCSDQAQKEIAHKVTQELQQAVNDKVVTGYVKDRIETGIVDYTTFYPAHEEHQEYLMKNPNGYCNHRYRFKQWPTTTTNANKKD